MHLDLEFVRSCFPVFKEDLGSRTAFLENASGSYMVGHALERLMAYSASRVQPYGYSSILSRAGDQMDAGKQAMADTLGVDLDNLYFGPSTTQNINTLAVAAAALMEPGSEIIVSQQEHEANVGAWDRLCQRTDASFKTWEVDPDTTDLSLERLEELLNPKVRLLCITHSSNILGTINPIAEIKNLCRKYGTRIIVDGVSFAPHNWPDLPQLGVDAYCFSTYKTFATHIGIMYVATDFVKELDPQCHYFLTDRQSKILDSAGPDHASIAALAGLGDYLSASHTHHFGSSDLSLYEKTKQIYELMHAHEQRLCQKILDGIQGLPIRIIGRSTMQGREANLALLSEAFDSRQLSEMLATKDIAANYGNFYAPRLLDALDIDLTTGILRISLSHYNSDEDIERLLVALKELHR